MHVCLCVCGCLYGAKRERGRRAVESDFSKECPNKLRKAHNRRSLQMDTQTEA